MIIAFVYGLLIINFYVCKKLTDTHPTTEPNSDWHTQYTRPKWFPKFLYGKFQNKWHIVEQVGQLPIMCIVIYEAIEKVGWWILPVVAGLTQLAWEIMPQPEHWSW